MATLRADFRVQRFNQLVQEKGYELSHYRCIPCFCLDANTGQPDPNCSYCERGWQYWGQENIRGVISGVTHEKQFAEGGQFMLGSMNLTVTPDIVIGYHDRIIHLSSTMPFGESIIRSDTGPTDQFRFPAVTIDRILGPENTIYNEDTDYSFSGRTLTWLGENKPTDGLRFSVSYMIHPTWLVLSHQHIVRDTMVKYQMPVDTHEKMPIQALCKLEFLVEE